MPQSPRLSGEWTTLIVHVVRLVVAVCIECNASELTVSLCVGITDNTFSSHPNIHVTFVCIHPYILQLKRCLNLSLLEKQTLRYFIIII